MRSSRLTGSLFSTKVVVDTINLFSAASIEPESCRPIIAKILGIQLDAISIFDADEKAEYGLADALVRAVYERLRGDFTFELSLFFSSTALSIREYDFAEAFSRDSLSISAVDTPDGNPFTWILIMPGEQRRLVTVDDDYRIVSR